MVDVESFIEHVPKGQKRKGSASEQRWRKVDDPTEPERELILQSLERIVSSAQFRQSDRLCDFLRYVVSETLAGRQASIKAYSIAVDVFKRPGFHDDPNDSIVRTSAHRLRLLLDSYNSADGADDLCHIVLKKGSYIPQWYFLDQNSKNEFVKHGTVTIGLKTNNLPWTHKKFKVFVLPVLILLASLTGIFTYNQFFKQNVENSVELQKLLVDAELGDKNDEFLERFDDEITAELVRFGSAKIANLSENAGKDIPSYDYRLKISLSSLPGVGRELSADWQLVHSDGTIAWVGSEVIRPPFDSELGKAAQRISAQILGQEGAVAILNRANPQNLQGTPCASRAQQKSSQLAANNEQTRLCLEQWTRDNPTNALAWALLSITYYRLATGDPMTEEQHISYITKQREAFERAYEVSPNTYYTRLAQLLLAHAQRDWPTFDEEAKQLLEDFAGYPGLRTAIAVRLAQRGELRRSVILIEDKRKMKGRMNSVDNASMMVVEYLSGNFEQSLSYANRVGGSGSSQADLYIVATYGQLGMKKEAQSLWATIVKEFPDFSVQFRSVLRRSGASEEHIDLVAQGLTKAGIPTGA